MQWCCSDLRQKVFDISAPQCNAMFIWGDPSHQNQQVVSKTKTELQKCASSTSVKLQNYTVISYLLELDSNSYFMWKERFKFLMLFFTIYCLLLVLSANKASRKLVGFGVMSLSLFQEKLQKQKPVIRTQMNDLISKHTFSLAQGKMSGTSTTCAMEMS